MCEGHLFDRLRVLHCNINCIDYVDEELDDLDSLIKLRFIKIQSLPVLEDLDLTISGWRSKYDQAPTGAHYLPPLTASMVARWVHDFYVVVVSTFLAGSFGASQTLKKFVLQNGQPFISAGELRISSPTLCLASLSNNQPLVPEMSLCSMEEMHFYGFRIDSVALEMLKSRVNTETCTIEVQKYPHTRFQTGHIEVENTTVLHPPNHSNTWVRRKSFSFPYDDKQHIKDRVLAPKD